MTVSSKVRLYDLAKDLKVDTKRLIEDVRREGVKVSVPSNAISKVLADKIRDKYFPKKKTQGKQTIKLLYIPDRSRRKESKQPHTKKRICPVCGASCLSKEERRSHLVSHHMNEVMTGKVLCRVNADELCQAVGVDLQRLTGIAMYMGCRIRNGSNYIPPMLVKELVRRIRLSAPSRSNIEANESQDSQAVANKDCSVSRSATNLSSECFDKLQRKTFGQLRKLIDACLKARSVGKENQSLATTDGRILLEYTRILESKLPESPVNSFRRKIVARIIEDIEIYGKRAVIRAAKSLNWKLLPKGKQPFQQIVKHFENLSKHRTRISYDITRLHRVNSLFPDEMYVGIDEFEGYVVFYFRRAETAVLDCPVMGNAIYVFGENWKALSHLTKYHLLNSSRRDFERIIHNGEWFSRLKSMLSTRERRADLRRQQRTAVV